jgi:sortase A
MFGSSSRRDYSVVLMLLLWVLGAHQLFGAVLIKAKAHLAPVLIARAWEQTLALGGEPVKPWPWADTWPVGRLRVPGPGIDQFVLAGDTGNALAFGPGHSLASAPLGTAGQAVIGGHRDTHFAFLQALPPNAELQLQLPGGGQRSYRITGSWVVNAEEESLAPESGRESLLLVTCYPFDTLLAGGPLRYVVLASPRSQEAVAQAEVIGTPRGYSL